MFNLISTYFPSIEYCNVNIRGSERFRDNGVTMRIRIANRSYRKTISAEKKMY